MEAKTSHQKNKTKRILAVDCEASSRKFVDESLMSVALVSAIVFYDTDIMEWEFTVEDTISVNLDWPGGGATDKETDAFWESHPIAFDRNTKDAMSIAEAASLLRDFIARVQQQAEDRNEHLVMLTDNAPFDTAHLSSLVCKHASDGKPWRISSNGTYLSSYHVVDVTQRIAALRDAGIKVQKLRFEGAHIPVKDAIDTVKLYTHYLNTLERARDELKTHV